MLYPLDGFVIDIESTNGPPIKEGPFPFPSALCTPKRQVASRVFGAGASENHFATFLAIKSQNVDRGRN
jgi:hypothetical protein